MLVLSRILQILYLVAANPHCYSRQNLADRFNVSVRTIQKDLDVIRHGLRLEIMPSSHGYHLYLHNTDVSGDRSDLRCRKALSNWGTQNIMHEKWVLKTFVQQVFIAPAD